MVYEYGKDYNTTGIVWSFSLLYTLGVPGSAENLGNPCWMIFKRAWMS